MNHISTITQFIIDKFNENPLVNTITFEKTQELDYNKENIYPLVNIDAQRTRVADGLLYVNYIITIIQARDIDNEWNNDKVFGSNLIDNLNETNTIAITFINSFSNTENFMDVEVNNLDDINYLKSQFSGVDGVQFEMEFMVNNDVSCSPDQISNDFLKIYSNKGIIFYDETGEAFRTYLGDIYINIDNMETDNNATHIGVDTEGKIVLMTGGTSGSTADLYWTAGTGSSSIRTIAGNNTASGNFAIATGENTVAFGQTSHTEGRFTSAFGNYAHAEGRETEATGANSHAEGFRAKANASTSHAEGNTTIASGVNSHAEGLSTTASNSQSHAEGQLTVASGINAHAEGGVTTASGDNSHAEGSITQAIGQNSHAGGNGSIANGQTSFVHGLNSRANGDNTIVLGANLTGNSANTVYVNSLNIKTVLSNPSISNLGIDVNGNIVFGSTSGGTGSTGFDVFVTGGTYNNSTGTATFRNNTGGTFTVTGFTTGATGSSTFDVFVTGGTYSNVTGTATFRNNTGGTFNVIGFNTGNTEVFVTGGTYSNGTAIFTNNTGGTFNVTGFSTSTGTSGFDVFVTGGTHLNGTSTFRNNTGGTFNVTGYSTAPNQVYWISGSGLNSVMTISGSNIASGQYSLAEGFSGISSGNYSHTEGQENKATGIWSHSEGFRTTATGQTAHAEGRDTVAGDYAHAEGSNTKAIGAWSHAEGSESIASGEISHAEGQATTASGTQSHAEGGLTEAIGVVSHAEGNETKSIGNYSHAQGNKSIANGDASHAEGSGTTASGTSSHSEGAYSIASGRVSHAEGTGTTASGNFSHSEGNKTLASGQNSHAEGQYSIASGTNSHCEGYSGTSSGNIAHSEGSVTRATGDFSHAEGQGTLASGTSSHAQGNDTIASGFTSHAEGWDTIAGGSASHAEGRITKAFGSFSHSEGSGTTASGTASHAEGTGSTATGNISHAEGRDTLASGLYSHSEGNATQATGFTSHAQGFQTKAFGNNSHSEGNATQALGLNSHAQNDQTIASGNSAHAEGQLTIASGDYSHAEGRQTTASGSHSHSQGFQTTSSGSYSHAEGYLTQAIGNYSHSEGQNTTASGDTSHAEGYKTNAIGTYSHAEGTQTFARGIASHAEGTNTQASGNTSHAEGDLSFANGLTSHAEGTSTAGGDYSHSEGYQTQALGNYSHSQGRGTVASGIYSTAGGFSSIASGQTSFVYGDTSRAIGDNTYVFGRLITGTTSDTTYVDKLNIKTIPSGISIYNLGIDVNGFVISGSSAVDSYTQSAILNGTTIEFSNNIYGNNFYNVNLSPILTGKVDTTLFNTYTGNTQNALNLKTDLTLFNSHTGNTNNPHQTSFNQLTSTAHTHTDYVPTGRTIEINGVIQNLSSNIAFRAAMSNTGALTYSGISTASTTTVNIGAVTGLITDNETNPDNPTYTKIIYSGQSGLTVSTIGSGIATYVMLAKGTVTNGVGAGQIVFQNTFPTPAQRKQMIYLSKIAHPNNTSILFVINEVDYILSPLQQFRDVFQAFGYINQGIIPTSNANLTFNTSGNYIIGDGINFVADRLTPNHLFVSGQTPATFNPVNQSGAILSATTLVDPTVYDVGGTTTVISGSNTRATNKYLFYVVGVGFALQRGQVVYDNLTEAIAGAGKETFVIRPNFVGNSILVGILSVTKGCINLQDPLNARFLVADKFGQLGGGNAGISVSTLQNSYQNGSSITTIPANGAIVFRNGLSADTLSVLNIQNNSGATTAFVNGLGSMTALSFVKSGGTSAQYLMADGSVSSGSSANIGTLEFNPTDATVWNNGKGNIATNTSFGDSAGKTNTTGANWSAFGLSAGQNNTTGNEWTAIGCNAASAPTTGSNWTTIGTNSGIFNNANNWTAVGNRAGSYLNNGSSQLQSSSNSIYIGYDARALANGASNEIVIGAIALGKGSNTIVLGNSSITGNYLTGNVIINNTGNNGVDRLQVGGSIIATSVKISGGTNTQFLMADGSTSTGGGSVVSQIVITTSVSISTDTLGSGTFSAETQNSKNVIVDNGANAINITVNGNLANFNATYVKVGTGTITFLQGSGRSLVLVDGTASLSGGAGSSASITSFGTTDYLNINNR